MKSDKILAVHVVSYAQNFEDVILWRVLGHIGRGTYIDIGAADPTHESVSCSFYQKDWRGVHVEPNQHLAQRLRLERPDEEVLEVAVSDQQKLSFYEVADTGLSTGVAEFAEEHSSDGQSIRERTVKGMTLASILDRYDGRDVHWLKIDVEGMEKVALETWQPSNVRPWVVLVESTEPNTSNDISAEWEHLITALGYEFVYFDGLNRFYLHENHTELKAKFGVGPNVFDNFSLSAHTPYVAPLVTAIIEKTQSNTAAEINASQLHHVKTGLEELVRGVAVLKQELVQGDTEIMQLLNAMRAERVLSRGSRALRRSAALTFSAISRPRSTVGKLLAKGRTAGNVLFQRPGDIPFLLRRAFGRQKVEVETTSADDPPYRSAVQHPLRKPLLAELHETMNESEKD